MNVVLAGECGTGKSSLINLIAGRDLATTSNDTTACTVEARAYETFIDGYNVKLWDTPGFNEGSTTRAVANTRASEVVVQLLHQLNTSRKIHLLVYCINGNRAKASLLKHYDTIRAFVARKVPVVAVITRLERHQNNMEDWWSTNERELANLGMEFDDHACITAIPGASFRERRLHSQREVRDLILRNRPSQSAPVTFPTSNTAMLEQKKDSEDAVSRRMNMLTASRRVRGPLCPPTRFSPSLFV